MLLPGLAIHHVPPAQTGRNVPRPHRRKDRPLLQPSAAPSARPCVRMTGVRLPVTRRERWSGKSSNARPRCVRLRQPVVRRISLPLRPGQRMICGRQPGSNVRGSSASSPLRLRSRPVPEPVRRRERRIRSRRAWKRDHSLRPHLGRCRCDRQARRSLWRGVRRRQLRARRVPRSQARPPLHSVRHLSLVPRLIGHRARSDPPRPRGRSRVPRPSVDPPGGSTDWNSFEPG